MDNFKALLIADINEAPLEDQTKATSGDYLPPAGKTIGRLVQYIEYGKHPYEFQGESKGDKDMVSLTFELLHRTKNMRGESGERQGQLIHTGIINKSTSKKATFYKMFMAMRYGREHITHMAQMLDEPFIIEVIHNHSESKGKTYANIGAIERPAVLDVETGEMKEVNVPASTATLRCFLWDRATENMWNSLWIDGEWTKDDGTVISKNVLQERCLAAKNFKGSPLEQLVSKAGATEEDIEDMFAALPDDKDPFGTGSEVAAPPAAKPKSATNLKGSAAKKAAEAAALAAELETTFPETGSEMDELPF